MEIEFFTSSGGRCYVGEFIEDLPNNTQAKITKRLELLEKHGVNFVTHAGIMKKLHGYELFEIIVNFGKIFYRILCVIRAKTCWLLHMFIKKSRETPAREIETAQNRMRELDLRLALAVNYSK